ncbi:MAG: hypothetical protein C0429_09015 [Sphingopyxis sp.]|jgi:3(or 17)beta-hydroxysteroid dehydrogenase|nr:hypothetical protein [Sphingopyxis sp.]
MRRVVLVTGARQGIGNAVALHFADSGDIVIGADLFAEVVDTGHDSFEMATLDVTVQAGWIELVRHIEARHGRLDVLVNNAGTDGKQGLARDPVNGPVADWDFIFSVNSRGCFLGCQSVIPLMAKSGGGAIINISSVASTIPTPFLTAYGASKAAVDHLTRSIALHCADTNMRIRCNSVHPGQVRTPMLDELFERMAQEAGIERASFESQFLSEIPMGEFQEPADIADAVHFLASEKARMITGQALAVDGGFLLRH